MNTKQYEEATFIITVIVKQLQLFIVTLEAFNNPVKNLVFFFALLFLPNCLRISINHKWTMQLKLNKIGSTTSCIWLQSKGRQSHTHTHTHTHTPARTTIRIVGNIINYIPNNLYYSCTSLTAKFLFFSFQRKWDQLNLVNIQPRKSQCWKVPSALAQ